ncbi:MAG: hypothetical protein ACK4VY_02225 [Brevundimonas sp.]
MRRVIRVVGALAALSTLAACVHEPAPTYQPGLASLQALRAGTTAIGVDDFGAGAGVNDSRHIMRGNSMTGGSDGAYSTYLQEALETELRNAGRLDAAARLRLSGTLTANQLDATGFSIGQASVGARFVLTRDGQVVYDKVHTVDHQWESSFLGAVAIPAAMQGYAATVQKLTHELFSDPAFQAATR